MIRKKNLSYYRIKGGKIHINRREDMNYACGVCFEINDRRIKFQAIPESSICKNCLKVVKKH